MLKLTEDCFAFNLQQIMSITIANTFQSHFIDPTPNMVGMFTSHCPSQHYRVYSTPNNAMWCCVGTGMEDHSKYNQFIYTHLGDSLFLNLFIASQLNWKEKGIRQTRDRFSI